MKGQHACAVGAKIPKIMLKESLNKLIPFMVRQAHHERNQHLTVRSGFIEGLVQNSLKSSA
jgi:hypothetical protein